MKAIDASVLCNTTSKYKEFFQTTAREVVLYGGAGSSKSYSVADKLILQCVLTKKPIRILVVRRTLKDNKNTCLYVIKKRLREFNVPFTENKSDSKITVEPYGSQFLFISVFNYEDIEKLKSLTDIDVCWVEEASEIFEESYNQLLLRLRGGVLGWHQIILTFNPTSSNNWIYNRFFTTKNDAHIIKVTVDDNPWADKQYIQQLESLKNINNILYRVYRHGEWGILEGNVYSNWEKVEGITKPIKDTVIGIDFGFNAPSAIVKIDFVDDSNEVYVEELLYASGLTNTELITEIGKLNIKNHIIYCDSAEPDRIKEIRKAGYRVIEAYKNIDDGITIVHNKKLLILDGSTNLMKEIASYCYMRDNETGKYIDKPIKLFDHLMDAMRYAIATHTKKTYFPKDVVITPDGVRSVRRVSMGNIIQQMQTQRMFN